jgi:hypothetical protein
MTRFPAQVSIIAPILIIFATVAPLADAADAVEAFGFKQGLLPRQVEQGAQAYNLGVAKWFGKTLIVQAQDSQAHSYMFNFCNEQLYEITQNFPSNFERMADFVDQTIKQYGQPVIVSATGGMGIAGFVRPINLYWKIGEKDYLRLLQLETSYALIYTTKNSCVAVPN